MKGSGSRWLLAITCGTLLLAGCSREATDWKQASAANSIEAYQLFLKQHPHGVEAAQAQTRIQQLTEQRDWQIATAANTRDAYQQFLAQHPASQWTQEARIRIENFAQAAEASGTPGSASGSEPAAASGEPASGSSEHASTSNRPDSGSSAGAPTGTRAAVASAAPRPASSHRAASSTHTNASRIARAGRSSSGARTVQLGAFHTRAGAQLEWKRLATRFATLRALRPSVVAVRSRGERLYRLQVRLATPAAASGLCATLRRHARACVRVAA